MEGHEGWDAYAPYYDWENAQTVGRRDVAFWKRLASAAEDKTVRLWDPLAGKLIATYDYRSSVRKPAAACPGGTLGCA